MHHLRKHVIAVLVALLLEAGLYAIAIIFPASKGILDFLRLPGSLVWFFVGGGMSMVDGLAPEWRTNLALTLGFLLNTILMYGFCLLAAKTVKIARPALQSR